MWTLMSTDVGIEYAFFRVRSNDVDIVDTDIGDADIDANIADVRRPDTPNVDIGDADTNVDVADVDIGDVDAANADIGDVVVSRHRFCEHC